MWTYSQLMNYSTDCDRTGRSYPRAKESITRSFYLVDRSKRRSNRTSTLTQPRNNKRCGSRIARRRGKTTDDELDQCLCDGRLRKRQTQSIIDRSMKTNKQIFFRLFDRSFFLSFFLVFFFSFSR